jgi:hypothetical protein
MNSLKTGLHAKSLVLPCENRADLEDLIEECYLHYHPTDPEQRFFVDDLIRCEWTLRRLDNAETQTWRYQNEDKYRDPEKYPLGKSASCNPSSFSKLQYRLDATPSTPAIAPHASRRSRANRSWLGRSKHGSRCTRRRHRIGMRAIRHLRVTWK